MVGRSLTASTSGIQVAKLALKNKNLSQSALAEELKFSWSTVNKFFTGKPIDRKYFYEICETLNLEWEGIALFPSVSLLPRLEKANSSEIKKSEELNPSTFLAASTPFAGQLDEELSTLKRNATRTRLALAPYILPRIRRQVLLEKCLKSIQRGVTEKKQRVIPILGKAGYGKSTLLGSIYDELILPESGVAWVALVRCNDLIESVENFAFELGEKVSGNRESIIELAFRMTHGGRGVLLIDTLDLVLEKKLVPIFRELLLQLLEVGSTVVFTCREQDYQDYFEPYHETFAGVTPAIELQLVTKFQLEEVKEAARAFIQHYWQGNQPEYASSFAEKIIALSADSQSLQEIASNPLLLALLCDLFALEENVPEDLTVSQLYEKYWNLRIVQGRKTHFDSRRVGMAKKNLCLEIAQLMYEQSGERLRDFVYESQLVLDEVKFSAYSELKSDGVVSLIGGERLIFFHQTFTEYAIARWFDSTPTGELAKNQLVEFLRCSENAYARHYVWAVIRQLLNLVSSDEFYRLTSGFDCTKILPFRAIAFAAVSHSDTLTSAILQQLLLLSLQLGDAYQDILLVAARSASIRHTEMVWEVTLELLRTTGQTLINKAAETAGELLTRLKTSTAEQVERALETVESRVISGKKEAVEERSHIFGQLICAYAKTPKTFGRGIDEGILAGMRKPYFRLGSQTRSLVIGLHLDRGVPDSLKEELLMTIITQPLHEQFKEKDNAIALFQQLLPRLLNQDSLFGESWQESLYTSLAPGWERVQSAVVGEQASHNSILLKALIDELFKPDSSSLDSRKLSRTQEALCEAIKKGGGSEMASLLLTIPIKTIPKNRISTLSTLIRELSSQNNLADELTALAHWISPLVEDCPLLAISMMDAIAFRSTVAKDLLGQLLFQVLPSLDSSQVSLIIKKLAFVPPQLEPYLHNTISVKEFRLALVRLYKIQAETSGEEEAIFSILNFCLDKSRDVALEAAGVVLTLTSYQILLPFPSLITITKKASFLGVRHKVLVAIIQLLESGNKLTESELLALCTLLQNEKAIELIQPLYKIIEYWVRVNSYIPDAVAEITFKLTERMVKEKPGKYLESSVANAAIIALKNIANLEETKLLINICQCTRLLLKSTNINRAVNHVFVIGLLERVAKLDEQFLPQVVREDLISDLEVPLANMWVVVVAIIYNQGKQSSLLDEILNDSRFPQEVKSRILRERDA